MKFTHQFVDLVPEGLAKGVLYVSIRYKTASHLCACDCGREVVTPLSPAFWKMTFDGETVSLSPSIGNWEFPCRAHYWITRDEVRWSGRFSREEIEEVTAKDQAAVSEHFDRQSTDLPREPAADAATETPRPASRWTKLKPRWWPW